MASIPQDVLAKLSDLQNQIWQTVSMTASEAVGVALNLANPLTTTARPAELNHELNGPMLVVQFSFANLPENSTTIVVPNDTVIELGSLVRGTQMKDVDENLVAEIRPVVESFVQGICLAIGNIKNEAVVATGLSIRYQSFTMAPNLQRSPEIIRTLVAVSSEEISGTLIWLADNETAHFVCGMTIVEEDAGSPFSQVAATNFGAPAGGPSGFPSMGGFGGMEDQSGLELLMDIPLEISVELGRVRMQVREVLELGTGSIVEIDKAAGEPVDVLVNGRLVARGEVVVIEDNFGVRITEILSPQDRVARLGDAA